MPQNDLTYMGKLRFKDQMNYPNLLLRCIIDVKESIRFGEDGMVPLTNLISTLTSKIFKPIQKNVTEVTSALQADVERIRNQEYPPEWSRAHRAMQIEEEVGRKNREAVQKILTLILDRLDRLNLLMSAEKEVERGGE